MDHAVDGSLKGSAEEVRELYATQKAQANFEPGGDHIEALSTKYGLPLEVAAAIYAAGEASGEANERKRLATSVVAGRHLPSTEAATLEGQDGGGAHVPAEIGQSGRPVEQIGFGFSDDTTLGAR